MYSVVYIYCWQQYHLQKMTFKLTLITTLLLASLTTLGQTVDSAALDLERLSDLDFFKKYSFYDNKITKQDIEVTKQVWSLGQLREIDKGLRLKGVTTLTRIDERPTKGNPYYIVGHYQLPTPDHLTRMSFYRVDIRHKTIDYQDLDDFQKDKWKRVE